MKVTLRLDFISGVGMSLFLFLTALLVIGLQYQEFLNVRHELAVDAIVSYQSLIQSKIQASLDKALRTALCVQSHDVTSRTVDREAVFNNRSISLYMKLLRRSFPSDDDMHDLYIHWGSWGSMGIIRHDDKFYMDIALQTRTITWNRTLPIFMTGLLDPAPLVPRVPGTIQVIRSLPRAIQREFGEAARMHSLSSLSSPTNGDDFGFFPSRVFPFPLTPLVSFFARKRAFNLSDDYFVSASISLKKFFSIFQDTTSTLPCSETFLVSGEGIVISGSGCSWSDYFSNASLSSVSAASGISQDCIVINRTNGNATAVWCLQHAKDFACSPRLQYFSQHFSFSNLMLSEDSGAQMQHFPLRIDSIEYHLVMSRVELGASIRGPRSPGLNWTMLTFVPADCFTLTIVQFRTFHGPFIIGIVVVLTVLVAVIAVGLFRRSIHSLAKKMKGIAARQDHGYIERLSSMKEVQTIQQAFFRVCKLLRVVEEANSEAKAKAKRSKDAASPRPAAAKDVQRLRNATFLGISIQALESNLHFQVERKVLPMIFETLRDYSATTESATSSFIVASFNSYSECLDPSTQSLLCARKLVTILPANLQTMARMNIILVCGKVQIMKLCRPNQVRPWVTTLSPAISLINDLASLHRSVLHESQILCAGSFFHTLPKFLQNNFVFIGSANRTPSLNQFHGNTSSFFRNVRSSGLEDVPLFEDLHGAILSNKVRLQRYRQAISFLREEASDLQAAITIIQSLISERKTDALSPHLRRWARALFNFTSQQQQNQLSAAARGLTPTMNAASMPLSSSPVVLWRLRAAFSSRLKSKLIGEESSLSTVDGKTEKKLFPL